MNKLPHRFIEHMKKRNRPYIALFFSIFGLYLRCKRLAFREMWIDELSQLESLLEGSLRSLWTRMPLKGEMTNFPGDYYLTYPFLQIFGANKWGLAIPHIISTVIGFYFLYLICKRHMRTIWGYMIPFAVICFNKQLIFHSFELRPYAVLPTLSLAVFYFSEMIVCQSQRISGFKKFLIGLFFVLTVGYHAYGILIVFFCMAFFVLSEMGEKPLKTVYKNIAKFSGILCLTTGSVFLWYASGTFNLQANMGHPQDIFDYIPNPLVNFIGFLKAIFGNLIGYKKLYFLLAGMVVAFLIPQKDRLKQIGFFLVLVVIPIQLNLIADMAKGYWFLQRQFVWIMPLFAFFLGWCWESIMDLNVFKRLKGATT